MMRHFTKGLLCSVSFFFCAASFAQKRSVGLGLIFETPAPTDTLHSGVAQAMTGSVLNSGPDDLVAGDTLVFKRYLSVPGISETLIDLKLIRLPKDLAAGEQQQLFADSITLYTQQIGSTYLCLEIVDDPVAELGINELSYENRYADEDQGICHGLTVIETATAVVNATMERLSLQIVPNPASNRVRVFLPPGLPQGSELSVTDILGRIINIVPLYGNSVTTDQGFTELDMSNLPEGLYMINLHAQEGRYAGKLWVRH